MFFLDHGQCSDPRGGSAIAAEAADRAKEKFSTPRSSRARSLSDLGWIYVESLTDELPPRLEGMHRWFTGRIQIGPQWRL